MLSSLFGIKTPNDLRPITFHDNPPLDSKLEYKIKASGNVPPDYTGYFMGRVYFKNGIAKTTRHFDVRMCLMRGCRDITDEETKKKLSERKLNRILVIRNAAFGDCLILTPALKALRQKYPEAVIDVYGRKDSRVVYENLPFINSIIAVRETELSALIDSYDEVFDLVHTIECCPEADRRNALDVVADVLQVEIKDPKPVYNPRQKEIQVAKKGLIELGVNPERDRIVFFQAEATAKARTLRYDTALQVANHIASKGFKVVMVGHNMEIVTKRLCQCQKCKNIGDVTFKDGQTDYEIECPCGGKEGKLIPNHPNLRYSHFVNNKYSPRERFAMAVFGEMIIAVDSFWSHLAAALDKPSVLIFSNYHPFTRTKYYHKASVVTVDYEKEAPCGPCNGLVNHCTLFPGMLPPCIGKVSPWKIIEAVNDRLQSETLLFDNMRDVSPSKFDFESRNCPGCYGNHFEEVTTKGMHTFVQCLSCSSIYTYKSLDSKYVNSKRTFFKDNKFYRPTRNLDPREFMKAARQIITNANQKQFVFPVVDMIGLTDKFTNRESFKKQLNPFFTEMNDKSKDDILWNTVLWVDGVCEEEDPIGRILELSKQMVNGGYLILATPLTEQYDKLSTWPPLNPPIAGLNQSILSKNSLVNNFGKGIGKHRDKVEFIGVGSSDKTNIVVLRMLNGIKDKTLTVK